MAKIIRTFTYEDDKSSKFWTIEIDGSRYTVKYGKTGTNGQTASNEFDSTEACQKAAEKVIKEKTGKGYVEKKSSAKKKAKTYEGKTYEEWLELAESYDTEIDDIPQDIKEPELWLTAVAEICLIALKSYGSVLSYIPDELRTEDFYLDAVKVNKNGKALKYVPEEFRTAEVCAAAVEKFPEAIEFVPKALVDQVKDQVKSSSKKATPKAAVKPAPVKKPAVAVKPKPAAKATPKKAAAKPAVVKKPAAAKKLAPAKSAPKGKKK
jgi:predicted DNA-binding WGR domain protein